MTQNKQFKNEVRRYAAKYGLAYADARRRLLEARQATEGAREEATVVPSEYYDDLAADLEVQDERNERVADAYRRLRYVVQQGPLDGTAGNLTS